MSNRVPRSVAGLFVFALVWVMGVTQAPAQVAGLYYQEATKDGRIYVFNSSDRYRSWAASGEMGTAITLIGRGPSGETLIGENDAALDLFFFKHNLPGYERPTPKPVVPPAYPKTTIGGRLYADLSSKEIKDKGTGVKSNDSGVGVDVKRFYFTVTHDFDATWSAVFQSDIGDVGAKRYDVFVKKAFLQAKITPEAIFRLGAADSPWMAFVDGLYGQRYLEPSTTDSLGFGASAEWGLHFLGKAVDNKLGYAFTIGNGKGYSSVARSKSVDFEGRVAFEPVTGLTFAVGGYSGKRGNNTDATPALHTASRFNALANWVIGPVKIGGEYFTADNWNRVTQVTTDKSDGYSAWLQYNVDPAWMLFGRYDKSDPSRDLKPALNLKYYNLGVQWKPVKPLTAALAYKCAEAKGGTVSTGNGAIGSAKAGSKGTYNEIGLWFSFDF
ncbi:MAG TPA: hypothetical protein PLS53_02520 [Thermoanaerobaculaceae bacterium]|nr:hypothetical protein [Thermoanaerobaculaceae bacterium]